MLWEFCNKDESHIEGNRSAGKFAIDKSYNLKVVIIKPRIGVMRESGTAPKDILTHRRTAQYRKFTIPQVLYAKSILAGEPNWKRCWI